MTLFNESNIHEIYNQFVHKDHNYINRFINFKQNLTENEMLSFRTNDVPRLMSIIDFKEWINKYNISEGRKLLYTCDTDLELGYLNYTEKTKIEYPPHDLHNLSISDKKYDFILFNQTLEHLYNPFICVQNLYNHLKTGGVMYTTVPIINIPHMVPIHFWGITPIGLCLLMINAGFKILECGYWGNKKYIEYIFSKNTWPGYAEIMNSDHTMDYDHVCQAQAWILVQK